MANILITGTAGFIGFHNVLKLLKNPQNQIVGLDNINDYYDIDLKYGRLEECGIKKTEIKWDQPIQSERFPNYVFYRTHLENKSQISRIFEEGNFDYVIHLAAQAGVRYSLTNPQAYADSNITGFINILEACREFKPRHLLYASSSSVYGANSKMPFSEEDNVDHPVSLYAATKKANELMAHTYSHLFEIPVTGLRFFTVYGPWGRPDMAIFLFTKAIQEGKAIKVFNNGEMMRDFTYIDDIVEGISRLMVKPPQANPELTTSSPQPDISHAPYRIYNIGNSKPEYLMDFISAIEEALGKKALKSLMPIQPGDVVKTWASTEKLNQTIDYKPVMPIKKGVKLFVDWYKEFYNE